FAGEENKEFRFLWESLHFLQYNSVNGKKVRYPCSYASFWAYKLLVPFAYTNFPPEKGHSLGTRNFDKAIFTGTEKAESFISVDDWLITWCVVVYGGRTKAMEEDFSNQIDRSIKQYHIWCRGSASYKLYRR